MEESDLIIANCLACLERLRHLSVSDLKMTLLFFVSDKKWIHI